MISTHAFAIAVLASLSSAQTSALALSARSPAPPPVGVDSQRAFSLHVAGSWSDATPITLKVSGASPGAPALFFVGPRAGLFSHQGGGEQRLGLSLAHPRLLHFATADANGEASTKVHARPSLGEHSAFVQAVTYDSSSPESGALFSNLIGLPKGRSSGAASGTGRSSSLQGNEPTAGMPSQDRLSSILDVEGVQRWYDPELSTFTAGTWEDLAGTADLRQPSAGSRPALNPTGLNGLPSLTFDGSNDHLFNAAPLLANLDQFTLILIAKAPRGQIDKRLVAEGSRTTNVPLFVPIRTGSNTRTSSPSQLIRNDAGTLLFEDSSGPIVFDDEVHFFGVSVDKTAGTITNFEDVELDDPDHYPVSGTFAVDRFTLGAMIRTTVQFHFAGEIGPLVVVDRALSVREIRQIRDYYEGRGYLEPYQAPPVSSAVPAGYSLVYDEDFTGYTSADEIVEDGQAPTQAKPFADSFVTFGVRYLSGNNDRCYKGLASDTGTGSVPLETLIGTKPHELANDNLLLRFGQLPEGRRSDFLNRQHAGGMLSTERAFAHGPGLFEVRMRVRNNPPGGHFSLWLLTQNTSPHELEVDLVEIVGNNLISKDKPLNTLFYNGHDRQNSPAQNGPQTTEEVSNFLLNQWHVYSFLYTPTEFTWYRDGVVVRQEPAYFDGSSPLYFLASWETNFNTPKNFPGPSLGNAPTFPGEVEIDYFRVYAPPADNRTADSESSRKPVAD